MKTGFISASAPRLTDGEVLSVGRSLDVKKNKTLIFSASPEAFSAIRLGHGEANFGGSYAEIDGTEIRSYNYTREANLTASAPHGLQIGTSLTIIIRVGMRAEITLITEAGSFTLSDVSWSGVNGEIFVRSLGSTLTDCRASWTTADLTCPVWVFGDSYLGLTNRMRFPYHMLRWGFTNWLGCGYPGASAKSQMLCFENLLKLGMPKTAVWCLGMNNNDKNGLNEQWVEATETFLRLCAQCGITPILSTIPTTWQKNEDGTYAVVRENRPKNDWVRAVGCRYVDFERAVGADSGEGWYDGMLFSDNVHPDEPGALALAAQILADVPELGQ